MSVNIGDTIGALGYIYDRYKDGASEFPEYTAIIINHYAPNSNTITGLVLPQLSFETDAILRNDPILQALDQFLPTVGKAAAGAANDALTAYGGKAGAVIGNYLEKAVGGIIDNYWNTWWSTAQTYGGTSFRPSFSLDMVIIPKPNETYKDWITKLSRLVLPIYVGPFMTSPVYNTVEYIKGLWRMGGNQVKNMVTGLANSGLGGIITNPSSFTGTGKQVGPLDGPGMMISVQIGSRFFARHLFCTGVNYSLNQYVDTNGKPLSMTVRFTFEANRTLTADEFGEWFTK